MKYVEKRILKGTRWHKTTITDSISYIECEQPSPEYQICKKRLQDPLLIDTPKSNVRRNHQMIQKLEPQG